MLVRKCLRRRRRRRRRHRQRAQVKRGRPRLPDSRLCARAFECRWAGGTRLPKPRVHCRLSARSSAQVQALQGKGCRFRTRPASLVRGLSSGRTDTSCGSLSALQVASLSAARLSLLGGSGGSAGTKRKRNGAPSARQKLWYKGSLFWVDPDTCWWEPHSEKPPPAPKQAPPHSSPQLNSKKVWYKLTGLIPRAGGNSVRAKDVRKRLLLDRLFSLPTLLPGPPLVSLEVLPKCSRPPRVTALRAQDWDPSITPRLMSFEYLVECLKNNEEQPGNIVEVAGEDALAQLQTHWHASGAPEPLTALLTGPARQLGQGTPTRLSLYTPSKGLGCRV